MVVKGNKQLLQVVKLSCTILPGLKRLDRENDAGAYTPEEFAQKRKELRAKMGELRNTERQEHEARRRSQEHQRAITSMQELLPHIRGWISGEDPLTVRFHLSRIITITAHPEKTVTVSLV